jgi:DNA-binding NtrC family response regulator
VGGTGTVLVIDDEETVLTAVESMLQMLGYQAVCFNIAAHAIEHFAEHCDEIDLVLLDMIMPAMDGWRCFRALREIDPNVRAVLMSGLPMDDMLHHTQEEGMLGFTQKPFDVARLSRTIADALSARG